MIAFISGLKLFIYLLVFYLILLEIYIFSSDMNYIGELKSLLEEDEYIGID
jgi:hypothetical protein